MARADLTVMLDRLDGEEPKTSEEFTAPVEKTALPKEVKTRPRQPARVVAQAPQSAASGARYLSLERKEARLRTDQYAKLTEEARRLNRVKVAGGERITENTLIRVAIDLLFERANELTGSTEAELRKSVSL